MATFRLTLEYDGTEFEGWQIQAGPGRTVQGCLLAALERISGAAAAVSGAGRTDVGVHAEAQLASARLETGLSAEALQRALNGILPSDLVVTRAEAAPDDFDARRAARSKLYHYRVWNAARRSPLRARYVHHVRQPLNVAAMRKAAAALLGEHDFSSFQAAGSSVKTSVRTLLRMEVIGQAGGDLRFEIEGTGFLRHMVRNIVGTLLEVGRGRREPDSIPALLARRDRKAAGPTAPARGLCLERVDTASERSDIPLEIR